MLTLKQKKERRASLLKDMRNMVDTAKGNTLSEEDQTKYEGFETEFENLGTEIQREEKLRKHENSLEVTPKKPSNSNDDDEKVKRQNLYSNAFFAYCAKGRDGMSALPDVGGNYSNALQTGVAADGGYTVPEEWERKLIKDLADISVMRKLGSVSVLASDKKFPIQASRATFGWIDELGAYPKSNPTFGQVVIKSHKIGGIIQISEELLKDSAINLPAEIRADAKEEFAEKEEQAFLNGDGNDKPTGLFKTNDVAGVPLVGKTGASQTTVTFDELIDVYYSLPKKYRGKATWIFSDTMEKQIRKIKDSDGQYVWKESVTEGAPNMLFGRPVMTSDAAPAPVAGGRSIVFGDLKRYKIVDRVGMEMQRLNELYAENGQVGFKAMRRVDGKLTHADSVVYFQQAA